MVSTKLEENRKQYVSSEPLTWESKENFPQEFQIKGEGVASPRSYSLDSVDAWAVWGLGDYVTPS
jgi:hypothetical protein